MTGMEKDKDFFNILADELRGRDNPTDLKSAIIAKVEQISPLVIVSYSDGKIMLTEDDELYISEWFRFRCNIDLNADLTSGVPTDLNDSKSNYDNAKNVTETHSQSGASCSMPNAISYLASAIEKTNSAVTRVKNELYALKCHLQIGDHVLIASLEQKDRYILIDKVLKKEEEE